VKCDVMCCSVLQCVAVCCSVLQCVAVCCSSYYVQGNRCRVSRSSRYVAVVVSLVAVRCSALKGVAVCYSMVQGVAVWGNVLLL